MINFLSNCFRDRLRTVLNVAGDCVAVGVTSHYTRLPDVEEAQTINVEAQTTEKQDGIELLNHVESWKETV